MLDIGGWEFLLVAFVLIMVVGPKELPKMLRSFTQFTRQMRRMAREFTDGMNQIANDAEVAELKKAMDKAKGGDLDELADAIDPGGEVGKSVRELKSAVDKDASGEDMKEIENLAGEAGQNIAKDAMRDDVIDDAIFDDDTPAKPLAEADEPAKTPVKKAAKKKS